MEKNIPILYYHFVKAPVSSTRIKGLYTSPKQFDWQIKQLIKKGFTFITFETIAKKQYDPTKRNIILTFDDGCESLYLNAFPILKKYGITAVIYVVAESIGARNIVWKDNENKDPLNILSKEQMVEMKNYGIEFGSHACNHVHLNQLAQETLNFELRESKLILETVLNSEIYSVAYPFGSYNNDVLKSSSEADYRFGVTTKNGNNLSANDLELFRIPVRGHSLRHYFYFYKTLNNLMRIVD